MAFLFTLPQYLARKSGLETPILKFLRALTNLSATTFRSPREKGWLYSTLISFQSNEITLHGVTTLHEIVTILWLGEFQRNRGFRQHNQAERCNAPTIAILIQDSQSFLWWEESWNSSEQNSGAETNQVSTRRAAAAAKNTQGRLARRPAQLGRFTTPKVQSPFFTCGLSAQLHNF